MLNWINKKRNKKGFTLIELVIVIAILGILIAIAVPRLSGFRDSAAKRADEASAETIEKAANLYVATYGDKGEDILVSKRENPESFVETLRDANLVENDTPYTPQQEGKTFSINYDADGEFTVTVKDQPNP